MKTSDSISIQFKYRTVILLEPTRLTAHIEASVKSSVSSSVPMKQRNASSGVQTIVLRSARAARFYRHRQLSAAEARTGPLCRRNNAAILYQRSCAVMIEGGDAEGPHRYRLEQGIDKWRDRCALGQEDQPAKQCHYNDDGQQPEFLADTHKTPKLHHKVHTAPL